MLFCAPSGVRMNLKTLSDDALHAGNLRNAKEEREGLTRILHWLRETERRRLFSKYKCKSLFEYAVKFMRYSNDQADRRTKAMRVLRDVPDIEGNINSGALNLTNLALAQRLFDLETKSANRMAPTQKSEVLQRPGQEPMPQLRVHSRGSGRTHHP